MNSSFLAAAIRQLRGAGIVLSDRRAVRVQKLVAAAAALDGRHIASEADLWPQIVVGRPYAGRNDQRRQRGGFSRAVFAARRRWETQAPSSYSKSE